MFEGATIEDPVFGKLKWEHDGWLGRARIEALGGRVDLFVHGNDPTDQQRQAFEELLKDQTNIHEALEWALFEYYNGMWLFRLFAGLPRLKEPDAIWEMVVDPMVSVLRGKGQAPPRITISWECAWGDDGVEVILEGGKAVYTGNDYGE